MTANAAQGTQPAAPSPSENGLGIAGFALSLIGLLSCGLLSPLGLIFSFTGMFRRPRGLAIAGLILSLVGCLWVVTLVAALGTSHFASFFAPLPTDLMMTQEAITRAEVRIEEFRAKHNALPDEKVGEDLIAGCRDRWNRWLRYERVGRDDFEIRSAGPDGRFDTPDDITPGPPGGPGRSWPKQTPPPFDLD